MSHFPRLPSVLSFLLVVAVAVAAETDGNANSGVTRKISLTQGRTSQCQSLWGKSLTVEVGNFCLEANHHDPSQLIVSFETRNGWTLDSVHVWLGKNESDIPLLDESQESRRRQYPWLEKFPYQNTELQGQHSNYGFVVDLEKHLEYTNDLCPDPRPGTNFVGAAHATVRAKRSAIRGGGRQTPGGRASGDEDSPRSAGTVQQDAWAASGPATTPEQFQKQWLSFDFSLMCDFIKSPPSGGASELRHHANQVPS